MSNDQKDSLARWLPTLVALIAIGAHVAYLGRWAGSVETRLIAIESIAQAAVPRTEYLAKQQSRDVEFIAIGRSLDKFDSKLDAIMSRQLGVILPPKN